MPSADKPADRLPATAPSKIAAEIAVHHHYSRLQLFRCYRSRAWRPRITLLGRAHADAALAAGAGVVFWVAPFVYNNLITKMAHGARLLESYVWRWPGQFDGWAMTDRYVSNEQ